ncbi:MAG: 50S ribosomal protein L29 [Crocinitomicaceae bacterium]|jgi:large subunit ribosomal protein L29|nr:50S ribosomal protein L29 [Crocinitomicaceae bacterium]MBK6953619.1 50S ribosomal protein L29 [Crocinitomicaceae bacterium]MBK9592680.1 50S ribosomal protein L29 [Crocinitomicaceae bacterium]
MKSKEVKEMSLGDLKDKIIELTVKQDKMVMANAVTKLENPLQIRMNRKDIARLKTELKARELTA